MIDQEKIGGFLRDLRKEKGQTQEELADKFGISSKTVSRWETGKTLPDLATLVELADHYDVDIKEIIAGERKSETVNKEEKETLKKIADYAEVEKALTVKRKCIAVSIGTFVFSMCVMIGFIVFPRLPEDSILRSNWLWLAIGLTGLIGLWGMVIRENMRETSRDK
jgi:transcriptional regulator with XRE-family HTH domain